ncbi:hypothetical protein VCHA53O466_50151 [Vibrio chagasii]|nr:hypothetical protein VCHA53O466_50151 [Vibrio chagasii]
MLWLIYFEKMGMKLSDSLSKLSEHIKNNIREARPESLPDSIMENIKSSLDSSPDSVTVKLGDDFSEGLSALVGHYEQFAGQMREYNDMDRRGDMDFATDHERGECMFCFKDALKSMDLDRAIILTGQVNDFASSMSIAVEAASKPIEEIASKAKVSSQLKF